VVGLGEAGEGRTYSTTLGAMTLQGPHHVAKQSTIMTPFSERAFLKSDALFGRVLAFFLSALLSKDEGGELR
jgi:hypothetical protein